MFRYGHPVLSKYLPMRKVIVFICMSLDGFLATEEDGLEWLSRVEKEGEDYGHAEFTTGVDTYIVGRRTYDIVKAIPGYDPADKYEQCYVITRQNLPDHKNISFYNGDTKELIARLKAEPGKNIYCDGGGQIVQLLMQDDLIDEYIVSVIPIVLGNGKRLFLGNTPTIDLKLVDTQQYETGLVKLHYTVDRSANS